MTKYVRIEATGQDGIREITAAGWDGRILRMPRDAYLKWRKGSAEKLCTAAVCVLFADDFARANTSQRFLHVGLIGAAPSSGDSPEKDKPFWGTALVFTSAGAWMTADHARIVQHTFIDWAREAHRYDVANSATPQAQDHDAPQNLFVQAFLSPVKAVLDFAGIDVFQFNPESLYTLARGPRLGRHDRAKARILSAAAKTIEIYQDSRLSVNQLPETVRKIEELLAQGAITFERDAGIITFTRPARLETYGAFDTILGTFPKDWLNKSRASMRDAFDLSGDVRPMALPVVEPTEDQAP